jgi:hypothetical protein
VSVAPQPAASAAPIALPASVAGAEAACAAIEGLPHVDGARCIAHERDQDDGVVEIKNTYVVALAADSVRQHYERLFAQNGWTLLETAHDAEDGSWEYKASQGLRRVNVDIDTELAPDGTFARVKVAAK